MPITINCQHFKHGGKCTHHAAPRALFGHTSCIEAFPPSDMRIRGCRLVYPYQKPDAMPLPPPSTVRHEGSSRVYTITPIG